MTLTREQAIEIARESARARPPSYYSEPFTPHDWVVDAVMRAANAPHGVRGGRHLPCLADGPVLSSTVDVEL